MTSIKYKFHGNGTLHNLCFSNIYGLNNNYNIPAFQSYDNDGVLLLQKYYVNGKEENYFDPETNKVIPAVRNWCDHACKRK